MNICINKMECARWNVVSIVFVLHFLIQNENFNKHACSNVAIYRLDSMIAAVAHKNRNSSRMPTWPEVAERRNYQRFLKLYLSLLLLVICSQYHHEHYRASTTHRAREVWRCYINVITRTCSGFY